MSDHKNLDLERQLTEVLKTRAGELTVRPDLASVFNTDDVVIHPVAGSRRLWLVTTAAVGGNRAADDVSMAS